MPTSDIRIVSETNLSNFSFSKPSEDSSPFDSLNLNNVMLMDEVDPLSLPTAVKTTAFIDDKNWQGGYSTIVTPVNEPPVFAELQVAARSRSGRRSTIKEEELSQEEEDRLKQRRERNKQAAARCRKRRVDQTESLQGEVDQWEEKKRLLQEEIHALQSQREELQFILDAHKSVCKRANACRSQPTQAVQRTPHTLQPITSVKRTVPSVQLTIPSVQLSAPSVQPNDAKVIVKAEEETNTSYQIYHLTHEEALNMPLPSRRPTSLSLCIKPESQSLRSIEGIPIETPTNIFSSLNFDALMDGRTGLTPTNILTPVSITMSLQTPVVSSPSCSTQLRNFYENGTPDNLKLVSL